MKFNLFNKFYYSKYIMSNDLIINKEDNDNFERMQNMTTGDIIVDKLIKWGVKIIFGLIGDGINPVIEALYKRRNEIKFITVRHEEAAAFMAGGLGKLTDNLSACIATTGPGMIHLINGLYDAVLDGAPIIAISGTTYENLIGTFYPQDVKTMNLLNEIASFNVLINGPSHALHIVDNACRSALGNHGLSHITIPIDIQNTKLINDKNKFRPKLYGTSTWSPSILLPKLKQIEEAAKILNENKKILILIGKGCANCANEVLKLAEILSAPIAKSLFARPIIDDEHPLTTQGVGFLGTNPSYLLMKECDLIFIIGCSMPYADYYPDPEKAKCIQIDNNFKKIGLRYPATIGLIGDAKYTLQQLIPLLKKNKSNEFLLLAQKRMKKWKEIMNEKENDTSFPLKPSYVTSVINTLIENDAIISLDTGIHTVFAARHINFKPTQKLIFSGGLQTMAGGLPFSIAAKFAFPYRQSIAIVGDGGFTMLMGELVTAVKYNLDIKVIIFKNNTLGLEKIEQIGEGFHPYGYELQPINFTNFAIACGAEGYKIKHPSELKSKLLEAFSTKKPAVIEIEIDPNESPMTADKFKINY